MGKLNFEERSLHWPLAPLATWSLERLGGSWGRGAFPFRGLRLDGKEQSTLISDWAPSWWWITWWKRCVGRLPACPPNGIPYMAFVFLTGNIFLDMKLILSQLFRRHLENVCFSFISQSISRVTAFSLEISFWTCSAVITPNTTQVRFRDQAWGHRILFPYFKWSHVFWEEAIMKAGTQTTKALCSQQLYIPPTLGLHGYRTLHVVFPPSAPLLIAAVQKDLACPCWLSKDNDGIVTSW